MAKLILKELGRYALGTYADIIYRNALLNGERPAFVFASRSITFSQYNLRVNSIVHALRSMGLKKGDGVGILSWNCIEHVDVTGAAMKGGFIVSPFNPRLKAEEIEYLINYSEVKALFVGPEFIGTVGGLRPRLAGVKHYISFEKESPGMTSYESLLETFPREEPGGDVAEDDRFIIFYTSGTTGIPRGAVYTHRRKLEEARTKAILLGFEPADRHVMIMPLFHIGGWSHFWTLFYVGACNVIMPNRSFDPRATLQALHDEKATDIHIVPTHLVSLLALPELEHLDLSRVKRIHYAASPMPVELLRKGIARFGPVFTQGFGQSESGPDITVLTKEFHETADDGPEERKRLASSGQPCMGVHARIVDEENNDLEPFCVGEIVVQSKCVMEGYWRKPDETRAAITDGFLHTGDMGYYDEQGFIYIVDRKKDMIITGGENVYPREVEEVLYRHPAVQEAAVIGLPDDKWIERVHAVIVLKEGLQARSDEIIGFCKAQIAAYKAPKSVEFVASLPKSPQGKILKREIRERYRQGGTKTV